MKKIIKLLVIAILLFINLPQQEVFALNTKVTVSGPTSLTPGQTANYTITFSSNETAVYSYSITGNNLSLSGPTQSGLFGDGESSTNSVTITAKAGASGTSSISVSGGAASTIDGSEISISGSLSISVKNASVPDKPASKPTDNRSGNNFLKSLTVSQGSLSFNKNTNAYTVTVENGVSSLNIGAAAEDGKASVSGIGSKSLAVYANKFTVGVTAENGAARYYTINVNRKDEDGNAAPLSKNNNLESLSIEGCDLEFSSDTLEYQCEVDNLVDKVEVTAVAADEAATVKVNNIDKLVVGPNEVTVVVTAESKDEKTYKINIIRSSDAPTVTMENLSDSLKKLEGNEIIVIADDKGIITKDILDQIKASKKILFVKKLDEDGKELYQWKFDGSKIGDTQDVKINLKFTNDKASNLDKLSNYAKGILLSFDDNKTLPDNTQVGVFVGDEYKDAKFLNLYAYDSKEGKISLKQDKLEIIDGYAWFDLEHTSDYYLTPATITGISSGNLNIWMVTTAVLTGAMIVSLLIILKDRKKIAIYKRRNSEPELNFNVTMPDDSDID